jgi:chromosome segregation ATPase
MAETNGGGRIDDHEVRIVKLKAARREVEDALVVMAHLESQAAARVKEHSEFIALHEAAMASYDKRLLNQEARSAEIDARLDKLVSSIGELIARTPPSNLSN